MKNSKRNVGHFSNTESNVLVLVESEKGSRSFAFRQLGKFIPFYYKINKKNFPVDDVVYGRKKYGKNLTFT